MTGAWQLVNFEGSNLNYLVADYLAEVTMGILARTKEKVRLLEIDDISGVMPE